MIMDSETGHGFICGIQIRSHQGFRGSRHSPTDKHLSLIHIYGAHGPEEAWCPVLEKEPELLDCQVQEDGASLEVRADNIAFRLDDDGAMQVSENGAVRWRAPAGALRAEQQGARLYFCSPSEDAVYGLGQDPEAKLDHNHQERRMWNPVSYTHLDVYKRQIWHSTATQSSVWISPAI